ncbi:hypothetical protein Tsubulata_046426 [Turnera subulata]|uniref:Pentacotripeptide-repeat region of PRORP domain-containing protein n=1 Tax=Turnera subulata TaxID=218843 RepID=A0A9Q0JEV3_9ROSI|nr:hypothetical protein Tsubulata_046426 [Turnera subulata]
MAAYALIASPPTFPSLLHPLTNKPTKKPNSFHFLLTSPSQGTRLRPVFGVANVGEGEEEKPRFRWAEIRPDKMTKEQKQAISKLPLNMTNRCKALMKQIICEKGSLSDLLAAWVSIMKPRRADWLVVLKELKHMESPLYVEALELALLQESFEANVRDYTKLIHCYGKQNRLRDAESALLAMTDRGFVYDQVTLTTMIHMYSKAGNHRLVEETFDELKLLGQPLDKRSYGSMIMAYIRAGMPGKGEALLREMDAQDIHAGTEVYKALLRAYSMLGYTGGAQRVFDAIQYAGIPPDVRMCGLLINAYQVAGKSQETRCAFENMMTAGIEPNDKCIALVLSAYEKENNLDKALDFLLSLERRGIMIGKEASEILAAWFGRLGVVKEVEMVLRDYASRELDCVP